MFDIMKTYLEAFKDALSLYSLPLKSQFRLLEFYGVAGAGFLTPNFNNADILGREVVIKGIKIVPFYDSAGVDFSITDGVLINNETILAGFSINRLFERYNGGTTIRIFMNGATIPIFQDPLTTVGNATLDLDLDNIYYRYPAKLESLRISVDGTILLDINTGVTDQPRVKVFLQCYLI